MADDESVLWNVSKLVNNKTEILTHQTSGIIGMLTAIFLLWIEKDAADHPCLSVLQKHSRKKYLMSVGWICCVITLVIHMYFARFIYQDDNWSALFLILYQLFHRPTFSAAIAWIVICCATGNGGEHHGKHFCVKHLTVKFSGIFLTTKRCRLH
jgi:hypothetical protein